MTAMAIVDPRVGWKWPRTLLACIAENKMSTGRNVRK